MRIGDYYIAKDVADQPTLWRQTDKPDFPEPLVRRCDVTPEVWNLILHGAGLS